MATSNATSAGAPDVKEITDGMLFAPLEDYGEKMGKPRSFKTKMPTLDLIGCSNYETYKNIADVKVASMSSAYQKTSLLLKTTDKEKIFHTLERGVIRDVVNINCRKDAIENRITRENDIRDDAISNAANMAEAKSA